MPSVLIPRTKLQPPSLGKSIVPRPRLRQTFLESRPLTVICAPAGSGKTTLALEWLASYSGRVAWLSLDADDNDPLRFIHGVVAALQLAGERLRLPTGQRNLKPIMTEMINRLSESSPLTLVLDDYHVITEDSIHAALAYLLDHIPASLRLVIVTRVEPPLPLARLRARRQVHELTLEDLRFTREESNTFLTQIMGLNLSAGQIQSLEEYTQGWIAGLQMAALSLQSKKPYDLSDLKERRFITEYLLNEVFNQQPSEVQDFLLRTSIPDAFSLPLCKAIIPGNAGRLLAQIQKANLFITTVGSWHQYHPLFREFLQAQLHQRFPEWENEIHRQSLAWFEQNGMSPEAIQHALAIADFETASRLIASLAPESFKRGELVTLRRWLDKLPEPVIWSHPRLCLTQIWLLLDSNRKLDTETYFQRLENFLEQNLQGEYLAVRALYAAMNHQPEVALKFARRAQASSEARDPFVQTYVAFGMGAAQKMGLSFFQAEQSFRDALALADVDGNSYIAIASLVNLADVLYLQARLFEAEQVCRGALKRFSETVPDACDWYWTLGRISYQRNELAESLDYINRAIELSAAAQQNTVHSRALLQRALIKYAQGKTRPAQADLDTADQLARGLQDQVVLRAVIRQRVLFAVEAGDMDSARRWFDVLEGYGEQPFPFYYAYASGRVLLAEKKFKEAHTQFESALNSLESADFALVRIEVLIWQAVCLEAMGKTSEGERTLERAVRQSQTEKILRPFIEARLPLLELIDHTGRSGLDWVAEILQRKASLSEGPALTHREREILQLLSVGMSNQEMAEKLVIAEGTLKRHIANLYQKLGVHNRAQAVRHFNQQ